jgi:hypothetical protein
MLLTISVFGQETKIDAIQTPPSPAFVLLGIEPASLNKPTTPRAAAVNLISAVQQGGALEVAPYWLKSHHDLTFEKYMNADLGQTIIQTLSISFATIPKTGTADTLGTRAGLGMRFMLVQGQPNRQRIKALRDSLSTLQQLILDAEDTSKIAALQGDARKLSLKIQNEMHQRTGFSLATASAMTVNFLQDNFSKGKIDKWGFWLTASYLLEDPAVDFLAVARIIGNTKLEGTQNVFDVGGRLVTSAGDFSLSCEYIQRVELNTDRSSQYLNTKSNNFFLKNTYRLTCNIEYKYNNDASVYITFGKNFSNEKEEDGTLTAQVGLNLGFGEIPIFNEKK